LAGFLGPFLAASGATLGIAGVMLSRLETMKGVAPDGGAPAVVTVLLLGSSLVSAYVVRSGEHEIRARRLLALRVVIALAGASAGLAALLVALDVRTLGTLGHLADRLPLVTGSTPILEYALMAALVLGSLGFLVTVFHGVAGWIARVRARRPKGGKWDPPAGPINREGEVAW
jgi:hypothetical protein